MTRLEHLLQQAAFYTLREQAVPINLEAAIAAEGGSLEQLNDIEDKETNG